MTREIRDLPGGPVTEVPEHLLRRSQERRVALGLATDDSGAAEASSGGGSTGGSTPAASPAASVPGGAPIAKSNPVPPSFGGPAPIPTPRGRLPFWVKPILVAVPVWALFYAASLGEAKEIGPTDPVELGGEIFRSAGCSGCHGQNGEGGVGPKLAGGEVVKTFPDEADHVAWVTGGSIGDNKPYGDPAREGGQRASKGGMPAFGSSLSPEEIDAVVAYEREGL